MRLESKGLGKIALPFRLSEARFSRTRDAVVFEGTIRERKVNWTYRAELDDDDIVRFMKLANRGPVLRLVVEQAGLRLLAEVGRALLRLFLSPFRRRAHAGEAVP